MPTVIAYGEDALTYWALTTQMEQILHQLGDESPTEKVLIAYRPSFGRRGAGRGERTGATASAQFGEFDAILATPCGIYLVESKWDGSSELHDRVLTLRPEQCARHRIMRWYLGRWRAARPANWSSFVERDGPSFKGEFPGVRMAPAGSKLARNLEYLLDRLSAYGHNTRDVLLYLATANDALPCAIDPEEFSLVCLRYDVLGGSAYFALENGAQH